MSIKINSVFYNILINGSTLRKISFTIRILLIFLISMMITVISFAGAFYIRFDFNIPIEYYDIFYNLLPLILISRIIAYYYYKVHLVSWRFVSMKDLVDTFKTVMLGSMIFILMLIFLYGIRNFPRAIFILEAILNLILIGGIRFTFRYLNEFLNKETQKFIKYVLIVGAGKAGVLVLNEIRINRKLGIKVIGFVDDNPFKKGTNIQGVPVLGTSNEIPELVRKKYIDEIIIAIPSANYKDIIRINNICRKAKVKTKILPGLGELIENGGFTRQLRDVSYEELLGRKVIKFRRESDYKLLENEIKGKAILVTGAGGSIGSELCRQIIAFEPRILVMYERYENSLYELEVDLRREYPNQKILPIIGDILDSQKLKKVLKENKINLVYHAAAYKHVPMMEREPIEALRNNVFGTMNTAQASVECGVYKFVLISTDKAVNPVNIMGVTKRLAEIIVQSMNGNGTKFISVRFGNVIGSNGSVIPLFKKQIALGGPVTVTHPEVSRYFMSISEAVQLVMTAGAMGKGGEIFLLDMGEPIRIYDLAKELIKLSGLKPEKDIDIVFTGLRPGEKLQEELYWQGEGIVPTENKKITMLKPNGNISNDIINKIKILESYEKQNNIDKILELIKEIVPESNIKFQL